MNDTTRRVCGYTVASAVVAALIYGGFVYKAEPDVLTLVSGAEMNLRMAASIPAVGADGAPPPVRLDLLEKARASLDHADQLAPGLAVVTEYRGCLACLEGDYQLAAGLYHALGERNDYPEDLRARAQINEARMLRIAGDPEAACALLEANEFDESIREAATWELEKARQSVADAAVVPLDGR